MSACELIVNCNLPELLVRDLATSENLFKSKAMTAGCPYAGLAAPGRNSTPPFRRPFLPCRGNNQGQQVAINTSLLHCLVAEESNPFAEELDESGELEEAKDGSQDSSNATSIGMVPSPLRTRQQSVATVATSDSGRCSSLFSRNALSPSLPALSPGLRKRESSLHSTWYEDEPDSPQDRPGSSVLTARTSISDLYEPASDPSDSNHNSMAKENEKNYRPGFSPVFPEVPLLEVCSGTRTHTQPRSSASQPCHEKPRTVDVPLLTISPVRIPSLKESHRSAESTWVASDLGAVSVRTTMRQRGSQNNGYLQEPQAGVPLIEPANGQTDIDGSAPPPIAFANRYQALHHCHAQSPSVMVIGGSGVSGFEEKRGGEAYTQVLAEAKKPSLVNLRRWADTSTESLVSSQKAKPYAPSAPFSPGIPLPPEILESLRVSITCFPETMLLTSSLSIETIRAYSKKFKHQVGMNRTFRGVDTASVRPSTSQSSKSPKRWNMSWLGHSQRSNKQPHLQHQQQSQQHSYSLTRGSQFPPFAMSSLSLAATAAPAPAWAPIKNIFPSASNHLCDALYAHLLAYNYVASLVPQTTPSPVFFPTTAPSSSRPDPRAGTDRKGLRIPHKAASLLGMDDPVSAAAAAYSRHHHQQQQQQQQQQQRQLPSSGRRVLTRRRDGRRGSCSLAEIVAINPRNATFGRGDSDGGGGAGSAAMGELLVGLGRCVNLLVATMRAAGTGEKERAIADEGSSVLFGTDWGEIAEGVEPVEPVLLRALCEVVKFAEERS
ncbi:hypothetical protein C7999DRAFT_16207 [Corynascus novoguineensis]|uniref:Uncharacterized protein n=1 Tax=Corynascus novoguineensis TaxID=1126955 RepID=A0AAN7HLA8_9PEZI|nr:hypothetical protein C7999DRAFT_16207 [Corynascus novoguineensis]